MFQLNFRAPRSIEDNEAAFLLHDPRTGLSAATTRPCNYHAATITSGVLPTVRDFEVLLDRLLKEGRVTKVFVVNRTDSEFGKYLADYFVGYLEGRGLFAVYTSRAGEL